MNLIDKIINNFKGLNKSKENESAVIVKNHSIGGSYNNFNNLFGKEENFSFLGKNIKTAQSVDILDTILRFGASYVSQGRFCIVDKSGAEIDHPLTAKMKNPNCFETQQKFFSKLYYYLRANGSVRVAKINQSIINPFDCELILLNPDNEKTNVPQKSIFDCSLEDYFIIYQENLKFKGITKTFKTRFDLNDLINVVDGLGDSPFNTMKMDLKTILTSQKAKYNKQRLSGGIIATPKMNSSSNEPSRKIWETLPEINGEMLTHKAYTERKLKNTGLSGSDYVSVMTLPMDFKSLTKEIANIDFDADTLENRKAIFRKMSIPQEISGIDGNSTFENQEKAMINFIQSQIENYGNLIAESIGKSFELEDDLFPKLKFDHLPIYAKINKEKIEYKNQEYDLIKKMVDDGFITMDEAKQKLKL